MSAFTPPDGRRYSEVLATIRAIKGDAYADKLLPCAFLFGLLIGAESEVEDTNVLALACVSRALFTLVDLAKAVNIERSDVAAMLRSMQSDADDVVNELFK